MLQVNVTLPVYNEEAQVVASVGRVLAFLAGQRTYRWEVVIADNGSTDGTLGLARGLAEERGRGDRRSEMGDSRSEGADGRSGIGDRGSETGDSGGEGRCPLPRSEGREPEAIALRVLHLDQAGRGRALQEAWLGSEADVLSYMDVDLSTDLQHLPELIEAIGGGRYDLAVGSRLLAASHTTRGWKRELISRTYNLLLRRVLGLKVRDAQCGFKALSRAAAQALLPGVRDPGFFFDTELLVRAQRQGYRIAELPVRWVDDADSRVRLVRTIGEDLKGVWRLRRQ